MSDWVKLPKDRACKLCGGISGKDHNGKWHRGCAMNRRNPQWFYCFRNQMQFFIAKNGEVVVKQEPRNIASNAKVRIGEKWLVIEGSCKLCGMPECLRFADNPRQCFCKQKAITYFERGDGTIVCRTLEIDTRIEKGSSLGKRVSGPSSPPQEACYPQRAVTVAKQTGLSTYE